MVEPRIFWGCGKLYIWKSELIFASDKQNYSELTVKHYSQICSNNHLCKTTTCIRRPMLSPPKQIPVQLLLYNTTFCLMQPVTLFFVSQMKKACLKQPLINFIQQCIQNKCLSDYIYSIATF